LDVARQTAAQNPLPPQVAPTGRRGRSRWPRATTTRIALIVFVALVASGAVILGFIARVTQRQLDADAHALIIAERDTVLEVFDRDGSSSARAVINAELRVPGPLAMLLSGPASTPGASGIAPLAEQPIAGNLKRWPIGLATDDRFHDVDLVRDGRMSAEPFAVTGTALPGGYRLLVGRSLEEEERLTSTLTTSLVAAVGLALAMAVGISIVLTRIIADRIQRIADVAGAVAAGDLGRRVDVPTSGSTDAFDSLGVALNAMLARIESLLDELRSITDGLAHDLRSPLTRMKARIDRLARSDSETTDSSAIAAIGTEADALLAMLDNSLEISRLEAGIGRDAFQRMDLAALVNDMAEMYEPLADENGVQLTALAALPVPVLAHRELLGRALSNLIDNALRYAASGGSIEISAAPTPGGVQLTVSDRGPGITAESREEALRRFGRLDTARSSSGAGLGLSLAASIAHLHGGTLSLEANHPGLRVVINLPGRTEMPLAN
jgi:signal transduction histidine kinase